MQERYTCYGGYHWKILGGKLTDTKFKCNGLKCNPPNSAANYIYETRLAKMKT